MIKSMTGYGMGSCECDGKIYTVEIKSVNNRYADYSVRIPRIYSFAEDALRKNAAKVINRGKVDIFVNTQTIQDSRCNVHLNTALVEGYLNALKDLSEKFDVPSNVTAEAFLRIPDVFNVENTDEDTEKITQALCEALSVALKAYDAMRIAEGERLSEDLLTHLDFIDEATRKIETRSPQIVEDYRARLEAKVRELLQDNTADDGRILTETAIFADKINVNEETVRLKSHTSQFRKMLASGGSVGRKIDFLIQEMNREINTIGSKSNDLEIAGIVIDVKAEIEKLREQIQNIE